MLTKLDEKCPICGGPIVASEVQWIREAHVIVWNGGAVRLTPMEATMFDLLWKKRGSGARVTWEEFAAAIWCNDPNGGPLAARDTIQVTTWKMRQKLTKSGISVRGMQGKGAGWRITKEITS